MVQAAVKVSRVPIEVKARREEFMFLTRRMLTRRVSAVPYFAGCSRRDAFHARR